jgi:hypothetical protein
MNPSECPRCRPTDPNDFSDGIVPMFAKCLCGKRPSLFSALMNDVAQVQRQAQEEQRIKAQAIHEYRLQHDPEYRARVEGEFKREVEAQQEQERKGREAETNAAAMKAKAEKEFDKSFRRWMIFLLVLFVMWAIPRIFGEAP